MIVDIFSRYGGLTLIRQEGESVIMMWDGGRKIVMDTASVTESMATLVIGPDAFPLSIGESIEVPGPSDDRPANCVITLDAIQGERAAIRIVAPRRVKIIRSERFNNSRN